MTVRSTTFCSSAASEASVGQYVAEAGRTTQPNTLNVEGELEMADDPHILEETS